MVCIGFYVDLLIGGLSLVTFVINDSLINDGLANHYYYDELLSFISLYIILIVFIVVVLLCYWYGIVAMS
jgi:ABC-type multidrug transport system permease subunit